MSYIFACMCLSACACFWCTIVQKPQRGGAHKDLHLCLLKRSTHKTECEMHRGCESDEMFVDMFLSASSEALPCATLRPQLLGERQHWKFIFHVRAFLPGCICFGWYVCTLFVCERQCVGAGSQQSTAGWWPNSARLNIKEADCCKGFSRPYSDMTTVSHTHTRMHTHR